jgi:hypothetical protein
MKNKKNLLVSRLTKKKGRIIEKMDDWDVLLYLRLEKKWMVQSHFTKSDIEHYNHVEFTDDEWEDFTQFSCDLFDESKDELMSIHVSLWKERGDDW